LARREARPGPGLQEGTPGRRADAPRLECASRCYSSAVHLCRWCGITQLIAPARQTRADRSDRHAEDCRDLIVAHAFKPNEQDGLALLWRKLVDGSSEVAQLKHGMCAVERRPV